MSLTIKPSKTCRNGKRVRQHKMDIFRISEVKGKDEEGIKTDIRQLPLTTRTIDIKNKWRRIPN